MEWILLIRFNVDNLLIRFNVDKLFECKTLSVLWCEVHIYECC